MQTIANGILLSNIITGMVSITVGTYLLLLWSSQERTLFTDLPFLFGVSFIFQFLNNIIRILPIIIGMTESTFLLFKIRALIILCSTLPLWVAVLHIWFPRIQKYHQRVLALITLYWSSVVFLSSTETLILMLCIPILLIAAGSLAITFGITWHMGRLKEVRSDLMVVSIIITIIGELGVTLLVLNTLATTIGIILAGIALINPWYKPQVARDIKSPPVTTKTV